MSTDLLTREAMAAAGLDRLTPWWTQPAGEPHDPARDVQFYLGFHDPNVLSATGEVPLFINLPRLLRYAGDWDRMPKARTLHALDSGGFTELMDHGTWRTTPDEFGGQVYRMIESVGMPQFASPQDWMCEPWIIHGGVQHGRMAPGTGLTGNGRGFDGAVRIHQEMTVESVLYLRENFPAAPWIPVLQGWVMEHYLEHVEMYREAGIDVTTEGLVGLGSVCRREATNEIAAIVGRLAGMGIRMHGFGVKTSGLDMYGHLLASADSMAWSKVARRENIRLPHCEHVAEDCRNCFAWATLWREKVLDKMRRPSQGFLDLGW